MGDAGREKRALKLGRETEERLRERRDELAALLHFDEPDSDRCEETIDDVIGELSGHVMRAAAIALDGGFKPASRICTDVQRLVDNPQLVVDVSAGIDGEAIGIVAAHYRREDEPPGTWWMDVTEGWADAENVRRAARDALSELDGYRPGKRRGNLALACLTLSLRDLFLRYNQAIGRSVRSDKARQPDEGRFKRFVDLVAGPWFSLLHELGYQGSATTVAQYAADKQWVRKIAGEIAGFRDPD